MTKKILAFGASNSKNSINKTFANFAAHQLNGVEVNLIDLNDFEMPIYSIDRQTEKGIPELAHRFRQHILGADGIVISLAEHNGSYSVAFKNIFEWCTRIEKNIWADKPLLLLATAPGPMGGCFVLETASTKFSRMTSNQVFSFSLPSFNENFAIEEGILHSQLKAKFNEALLKFDEALRQ